VIVFLDAHIHSKYSRATSESMDLEHIANFAKLKGLNMLGTGDFTHPLWMEELRSKLHSIDERGIFTYKGVHWLLTTEVNTVYRKGGKLRQVHHLIFAPDFEVAVQINDALSMYGDLAADGRPTLSLTSPELVELLLSISWDILVLPTHCWTSWYGALGEFSGFDSLEECYEDQGDRIYALETGMSSDPLMNWRLSSLDRFTLLSFSDAHSFWTWRIGRELVCFKLDKLNYREIVEAIKNKERGKILFTVETPPQYGRYYYTGHRKCGVSLHPRDALKLNNMCPKCGRKLTVGVLQRVEQLADREEGYRPKNVIPFKTLLPLYEIVSFAWGVREFYSKKVMEEYEKLVRRFGNELEVLIYAPEEELLKVTDERVTDAIVRVREGRVEYVPGSNGQYGFPVFEKEKPRGPVQKSITEYF